MTTVKSTSAKPMRELKAELVRRGISQVELARRMGIGRSYLSQMLNGIEPLKPHYAKLIATCASIPMSVVLPDGDGATA